MANIVLATLTMPTRNERTCLDRIRGFFADPGGERLAEPNVCLVKLEIVFQEAAPQPWV